MKTFRDLVEANAPAGDFQVEYDKAKLEKAYSYHDDAEALFDAVDQDELDNFDDMESENGFSIPHNGDRAYQDDAGCYFLKRKKAEIIDFLLRVKIDGERIRKTDFKNWENYDADLENPIDDNFHAFFRLSGQKGVMFSFGIDTGDRWGVITAVGLV